MLSALVVAEHALKGPNTARRFLIAKLALSASGLTTSNVIEVRSTIARLELIYNVRDLIDKLSNCSFLYWHRVLLPVYFSKFLHPKMNLCKCYLMLSALSDCEAAVGEKKNEMLQSSLKLIDTNLLAPLKQTIETNLRLQTHIHLQLPTQDPSQSTLPLSMKKIYPASLSDNYLHIKQDVEHYLSTMFYNLTTVVLHDWRTYGEMRR